MKSLISEVKTDLLHRDCTLNFDSIEKRLIESRQHEFLRLIEQEIQSLHENIRSVKFPFHITSLVNFPHTPHLAVGTTDGKVHIVSLKLRQVTYSFENLHHGPISRLAICPGGLFLFTVGYDRKLVQSNVESKKVVNTFSLPSDFEGITNLLITRDGKFAVLSSNLGKIYTINLYNSQVNIVNDHNRGAINSIVLTYDGLYMITASEEDKIRIYDVNSLYLLDTINVPPSTSYPITAMALSLDSKVLVAGSKTGGITIFNFQLREEITSLKTHFNNIEAIAITPDSNYFFLVSQDKSLALFDLKRGLKIHNFSVLRDLPIGLAIDSDGQYLSCASSDGKISFIDLRKKENLKIDLTLGNDSLIDEKSEAQRSICVFLNDEKHLLAGTHNYLVLYNYVQNFIKYESVHFKCITAIAVDYFGKYAAVADELDIVVIDLDTLQNYHIFSFTHQGKNSFLFLSQATITNLAFALDGKCLVSGSIDTNVNVWDLGKKIKHRTIHNPVHSRKKFFLLYIGSIKSLMIVEPFDPHILCVGANGRTAKLSIEYEEDVVTLSEGIQTNHVVAVSNNMEYFASASVDCEIAVTRVGDKKLIAVFRENDIEGRFGNFLTWVEIISLKFSPFGNSNHLLSISSDNTIVVWDIEKHQKVHVIDEIKEEIHHFAVSPDGGSYAIATATTVYFYRNVWVGESLNISESFQLMPYPFIGALLLKHKFLEADHRVRKEFILQYPNLNIRKYGWNMVHLICNFIKENSSHYLEACQSVNIPFEVDNSGLTTFHYLVDTAPGKVDWQSVNLLLKYFISSVERIDDRNIANLKKHQIISQISEIIVPLSMRVNSGLLYKLLKMCVAEPLAPPGEDVVTMGSIKNQTKNHGIVPLKSCLFADAKDQLISNEGTDLIDIDVVLLKLDYSPLSNDMLDMVKMLLALKTENFFRTRLFSILISHLWEQHRKFHYYLLCFFSFLMIMLSAYLAKGGNNVAMESVIFTCGMISVFYEILQAYHSGFKVYISEIWNVIDIFYHTLLLSVLIISWSDVHYESMTLKWARILTLLMGYAKWVSFFRIHFQTRRLIRTIVEIIKALMGFSLVIGLIIFGFTIAFLELNEEKSFSSHFLSVYSLIYANFSFDDYNSSQITLIIIFTIMLSIILLNLMIAIMGDTYGKVQSKHTLTEGIEKLSLIMEAMIMKRPFARLFEKLFEVEIIKSEKSYLYFAEIEEGASIEVDDDENDNEIDWEAKIEHIVQSMNLSTKAISEDVRKIERKLEDRLNGQFALLKTEMLEKLEKSALGSTISTCVMGEVKIKDVSNSF